MPRTFKDNIEKEARKEELRAAGIQEGSAAWNREFGEDPNYVSPERQWTEELKASLKKKALGDTRSAEDYAKEEKEKAEGKYILAPEEPKQIDETKDIAEQVTGIESPFKSVVETQPKEEDKSLKSAMAASEAMKKNGVSSDGKVNPTPWEELRNYIDTKEEEVLTLQKEESQKLMSEEAKRKKSAQLGKIFGDLINAAALLYAAKQGVEADLKLADPSAAEEIRDIEREMDYKRSLLRDKIAFIRKKNYELYGSKVGEQEKKEKEESAAQTAEAKALADRRKAAESQSKEERNRQERIMEQIIKDTKGTMKGIMKLDGDALTKELMKYKIPEDKAEELSGEGFWWDDPAKYNEVKSIIRNYHARDWGLVPEQTDQTEQKYKEVKIQAPDGTSKWVDISSEEKWVDKGGKVVRRR